jgi:hypothetical protein
MGKAVAWGGAQVRYDVKPDLTCLGKVIGGGLPCAAYGGPRKFMDLVSPTGGVYQREEKGTFLIIERICKIGMSPFIAPLLLHVPFYCTRRCRARRAGRLTEQGNRCAIREGFGMILLGLRYWRDFFRPYQFEFSGLPAGEAAPPKSFLASKWGPLYYGNVCD